MQCVNMTDDELWRRIAQNTTLMSALVYRRIELDASNTRNDVIHRAQLMQSNLETISKLERAQKQPVAPAIETAAVEVIEQPAPSVITATEVEETRQVSRAGQRDCAEMPEGQGIMNVLRSLWAAARQLRDVSKQSAAPQP
jgi:CMP-N-acetylneuraminic acid synthetase